MKKFSLFILYCLMPTIANSSSNFHNTDVNEEGSKNDNTSNIRVQKLVNSEVNPLLPNTDETTAFIPHISSRENGWGEQKNEPFTLKGFTLFNGNNKRPNGDGTFYNCPVPQTSNKYCLPVKGQLNSEQGLILPKGTTLDSDGFIKNTDLAKPVLYGQGNGDLKNYFYRFWNNNRNECPDNQPSCWSPSYPIICNNTFNYNEFKKLENDKDGALKARHYFGWRENLNNNTNAYTDNNDYKIHVYMAPIKQKANGREFEGEGIFTALSPTGWKKNGNCLDPEFDYDLEQQDTENKDNTTTETLVPNDQTSSLSAPKQIGTGQILPCGNFSNNNGYQGLDFKGIATTHCKNLYYTIRPNEITNYDKYAIHLPLSTKFTNSLQQRDNYDKKNIDQAKQMRTRICGTCENLDNVCTEITHGVLFEKCKPSGNKFKCTEQQLENVVYKLKFNNPSNFTGMVAGNKVSGYTNQPLECLICLHKLDTILAELLADN